MTKVKFFDSTLRDGSHAIKHQLSEEQIQEYCKAIDLAGMYTVIVGHGNGLGGSSCQVGMSRLSDEKMLCCAKKHLKKTKLGVYLMPGFATIQDDIIPAFNYGVDVFCVGSHCTETNITRQHIEYVRKNEKEAYGVMMMYHTTSTSRIVEEALKMQSYGAQGVIIMDSAGASTPELVKRTIYELRNKLDIKIGFHPHNNLGLAVINGYIAICEGADIIDGTLRGFGAGAGNCQLEALIALLDKENYNTGVKVYDLFDISENIVRNFMAEDRGLRAINIVSGMAGVMSSFEKQVKDAAQIFHVNSYDIFKEMGRRKAVAGQEDMALEIAAKLAEDKRKGKNS